MKKDIMFNTNINKLIFVIFSLVILSCNNSSKQSNSSDVPFIGVRGFETRAGVSGTGTPRFTVEIKKNKDVIFRSDVIPQGLEPKNLVISNTYYAGKFSKYMYCLFEWDDFPRYYEITEKYIYEVDSNFKRLSLSECCKDVSDNPCLCFGELYELDK